MERNLNETDRRALDEFGPPPPLVKANPSAFYWWNTLVPALAEDHRIRRIDVFTLSALCLEISSYEKAKRHLRRFGQVVKDRAAKGASPVMKRNPSSMIASNSLAHIRELWKDLLLQPTQREGRGQVPSPDDRLIEETFFSDERGKR